MISVDGWLPPIHRHIILYTTRLTIRILDMRNISDIIEVPITQQVDVLQALDRVEHIFDITEDMLSLQWYTNATNTLVAANDAIQQTGSIGLELNKYIGDPICEAMPVFCNAYYEKTVESIGSAIMKGLKAIIGFIQKIARYIVRHIIKILYRIAQRSNLSSILRKPYIKQLAYNTYLSDMGLKVSDVPLRHFPIEKESLVNIYESLISHEKDINLPGARISSIPSTKSRYDGKITSDFKDMTNIYFPLSYIKKLLTTKSKKINNKEILFVPFDNIISALFSTPVDNIKINNTVSIRTVSVDYSVYNEKIEISVPRTLAGDTIPLGSYVTMLDSILTDMVTAGGAIHSKMTADEIINWYTTNKQLLEKYISIDGSVNTANIQNISNNVIIPLFNKNTNMFDIRRFIKFIAKDGLFGVNSLLLNKSKIGKRVIDSLKEIVATIDKLMTYCGKQVNNEDSDMNESNFLQAMQAMSSYVSFINGYLFPHIHTVIVDIQQVDMAIKNGEL